MIFHQMFIVEMSECYLINEYSRSLISKDYKLQKDEDITASKIKAEQKNWHLIKTYFKRVRIMMIEHLWLVCPHSLCNELYYIIYVVSLNITVYLLPLVNYQMCEKCIYNETCVKLSWIDLDVIMYLYLAGYYEPLSNP